MADTSADIPEDSLLCVEYPGYVAADPSAAIATLGGVENLAAVEVGLPLPLVAFLFLDGYA